MLNTSTTAYDYEAQRWVTGDDAKRIRRAQLEQDLAIIESERGVSFLLFSGCSDTCEQAATEIRRQLAAL